MSDFTQNPDFVERLKDAFDDMVVYKDLSKTNFISSFKLPSFMRDWVLKRFQDEDGDIDVEGAMEFIQEFIPKKENWNSILNRVVNEQDRVKFLAKISVYIDIASQTVSFELPDFGLGYRDTIIPQEVWRLYSDKLLKSDENWGIVEISYQYPEEPKGRGLIRLDSFGDFCPYEADLDDYRYGREDFSLSEWIDILLGAADYNAAGYESTAQKLAVLQRMLPFVEKQINLLELAPPGTGKSYFFEQISRFGWLNSGKATRAKLIYDMGKHKDGVVAYRDFVALDEIREAKYMEDAELQSALQAIMQSGSYKAPDNHEVKVDAGIIFLGNIMSEYMDENQNMLQELPRPFHLKPFLDRIHGFIKGWEIPRMNDDLKVCGWALNSEYFSTVLHQLRDDGLYRSIIDNRVIMPPKADTRDTDAIKKIATAWLKLLFPHVRNASEITKYELKEYCLKPAMEMRQIIRNQMKFVDSNSDDNDEVPEFDVTEDEE